MEKRHAALVDQTPVDESERFASNEVGQVRNRTYESRFSEAALRSQERACLQQDLAMAQSRIGGKDERSIGEERRGFACTGIQERLFELSLARAVLAAEVQVSKERGVFHCASSRPDVDMSGGRKTMSALLASQRSSLRVLSDAEFSRLRRMVALNEGVRNIRTSQPFRSVRLREWLGPAGLGQQHVHVRYKFRNKSAALDLDASTQQRRESVADKILSAAYQTNGNTDQDGPDGMS